MVDLGSITLETNRLILRKLTVNDAKSMYENWATDENVIKHVSFDAHKDVDETIKVLEKWVKEYDDPFVYNWGIVLKETNELIGQISLVNCKVRHKMCEVGYALGSKWWNNGYMSEALKKVVHFLINDVGFECVEGKCFSDNKASGRVMQKAGLKYDTTLPERRISYITGERVDLIIYSALRNKHRNIGWEQDD